MTDTEIKEVIKQRGSASLRAELEALRDKIDEILKEHVDTDYNKNPVNVHAGFSPNRWVELDPRDKAKNLLKRF